jgi:uncharacterized phage protein (TIGR02218 family)
MTYSAYESSTELGTPVELYEFVQGTTRWTFASGVDSIIRQGQVYKPSNIKRDNLKQTTDVFKDTLKLSFSRADEFASQFLAFAPEEITTLTIYRGHYGDTDSEFVVYWKGRVTGAKSSENTIDVQCESVYTSIRRPGLRARFEYGCRRTLYLSGCDVNRELYLYIGTLQVVNSLNLTVSTASLQANGYWTGGIIVAEDGTPRFITNHVGDVITVSRPFSNIGLGESVKLYPGCDHLKETCKNKFNNLDNFGGFPWIPVKNPYSGTSIA